MTRRILLKAVCLGALTMFGALASNTASAQAWPDKPVKLVLSQPPGSGPDSVARLVGEKLQQAWGQPVVVDNKPGGQNVIGAQAVARAAPDGYTFYFATAAALVTNSYMFKTLPYDPQKDFAPVAFVGTSPFAVLVRAESPIKSIEDLIAQAKANPGKLSIANEGPKTFGGLTTRLFASRAKIEATMVAYVSVGVAVQDTIGGHTDALMADLASTAPLIKQGRLRVLATTAAKRVGGWEQTPALSELLPGFDMVGWFAVVAPTGTPPAAINRFNKDLDAVLRDKDMAERIHNIGPIADGTGTPDMLGSYLSREHARWNEISKEIGLLPE
ncbi:tripartite tricarboxylate transporter substrate binding protein [soil metagenome]